MPLWNNNSGDWMTGANWIGGVPANGFGETAYFVNTTNGGFMQVGIQQGAPVVLGTLDVTLTGTTDMVIKGSTNDAGTAPARLRFENVNNPNLDPYAFVNINTAVGGGEFEISGLGGLEVELKYDTIFNVANAGTFARLNAPLVGGGSLVKDGAGTLIVSNNNAANTAWFNVNEGILHVLNPSSFSSGGVLLRTGGILKTSGTVDKIVNFQHGDGGLQVANGATLTFSGHFSYRSAGTMTFGNAVDNGTIVLSGATFERTGTGGYRLDGGTVRFGDTAASTLFNFSGQSLVEISTGATLDTGGFITHISNLDMDGGTLRTSSGALRVTVNDRNSIMNAQTGTVIGTAGNDYITVNADYGYSLAGLSFSGWGGGVDNITMNGNANGNTLTGSTQRDTINGNDGDDTLAGNGGTDWIYGGEGNDLIILNSANTLSHVDGGAGTDTLRVTGGTVDLTGIYGIEAIELQGGARLQLTSGEFSNLAANTSFSGTGTIEVAVDGNGMFFATGMPVEPGSNITYDINGHSTSSNVIKANLNVINDITGGVAGDQIRGGNFADTINGGDGNDKIMALGGADMLTGGAGADQFRYLSASDSGLGGNADRILDFVAGTDKLDFRIFDTDAATPGYQTPSFIGTNAFVADGSAQVRWSDLGADLRVEVDANGDGAADMHIMLQGAGAQTLSASDFLFI